METSQWLKQRGIRPIGASTNRGFHLPRFGFRPPSQEAGLAIAICAIVGAVVFLQLQGVTRPRPVESPGISIEATGALPVVPPPP